METNMKPIPSSEITPEHIYRSRRKFLKALGFTAAGTVLAACGIDTDSPEATPPASSNDDQPESTDDTVPTDELGRALTDYTSVIGYNNYYEFDLGKTAVAPLARDFPVSPWSIEVSGLVNNPRTFSMEDIYQLFEEEERIYRMRCVEGWSMVIPWLGFPLSKLLAMVEPTVDAKYVYFETAVDEDKMPVIKRGIFQFPYTEGLRLDEAMHDLTILSTGLYGERLMPQNGAPIRLVVPWKYGFKSIKSIVKIKLVDSQPYTFWNNYAPQEYGFYSNVNPDVPHPRWSQATEVIIGHGPKRVPTLLFNGYEEEVASLYEGMDLVKFY
jgi:methionine sulfoxide reductase catalytic subunit